jgi:DNA-binding NarL/FixJ family response regulator
MRIVLVDDDRAFTESLRTVVENDPAVSVVGVARDGIEALDLVDEAAPQAVLMDLHMPLLDGVSTIARLRQDYPWLCLIAMTADNAPELHRAVEEAGADAVILKHDLPHRLADQIAAARERAQPDQRAVM